MLKLDGPQEKKKKRKKDWRQKEPRCAPLQPSRMETETLGRPSAKNQTTLMEKGIMHINRKMLKRINYRVEGRSEPGLGSQEEPDSRPISTTYSF